MRNSPITIKLGTTDLTYPVTNELGNEYVNLLNTVLIPKRLKLN